MTISRRQFLAWAVATPVIALPAVKYFLPPAGGWPTDDFDLGQLRYKSYERYSVGWSNPKAFYGTSDGVALKSAAHPIHYEEVGRRYAEALAQSMKQTQREGLDRYLTSNTSWYLKTENKPGLRMADDETRAQYYQDQLGVPAKVSRQALEDMVIWLRERGDRVVIYPGRIWWKA